MFYKNETIISFSNDSIFFSIFFVLIFVEKKGLSYVPIEIQILTHRVFGTKPLVVQEWLLLRFWYPQSFIKLLLCLKGMWKADSNMDD